MTDRIKGGIKDRFSSIQPLTERRRIGNRSDVDQILYSEHIQRARQSEIFSTNNNIASEVGVLERVEVRKKQAKSAASGNTAAVDQKLSGIKTRLNTPQNIKILQEWLNKLMSRQRKEIIQITGIGRGNKKKSGKKTPGHCAETALNSLSMICARENEYELFEDIELAMDIAKEIEIIGLFDDLNLYTQGGEENAKTRAEKPEISLKSTGSDSAMSFE
jgi:hypothetical protein